MRKAAALCLACGLSFTANTWRQSGKGATLAKAKGPSAAKGPSVTPDCVPCPSTALEVTFYKHDKLKPAVSVLWPAFPWRVRARSRVQLVLQLPKHYKACNEAQNYLAWFGASKAEVLFAARGSANASETAEGRLTLDFVVQDAGVYDVWIWAFGRSSTRAVRFPRAMVATSTGDGFFPEPSGVEVPERQCQLGQESFNDGRWVKVSALRFAHCDLCTPDGFVYLSPTCHWALPPSPEHVLRRAAGRSSPLWVVFMGNSVSRGSAHAIMDFLGRSSLREFWNLQHPLDPGYGTAVKCWGWFDAQIDNVRVSYSDFRLIKYNASGVAQSFARMGQIISEGVNLLVLSQPLFVDDWRRAIARLLKNLRPWLPLLRGRVVLAMEKLGPWTPWGCMLPLRNETLQESVWRHLRVVTAKWPAHLRALLDRRLLVVDETSLALPMFFNMQEAGSLNWHRYKQNASARSVMGAVPSMMGRLYLMELLRTSEQLPERSGGGSLGARVCAECPQQGCCPWTPPAVLPAHSLSNAGMDFLDMKNLSLSSCAKR
ncbi:unnamed protein product [Effrenium voratum]|uniref:Uncharacterized protein n=1 Tax=Effrenium voratum TaxID=2562239 RepID=A0AA36NLV4_9DINO|nr:unnamed protein product [Effrenium voratum]CAJ1418876.1 unnamed protein product [Effrenium voratum]